MDELPTLLVLATLGLAAAAVGAWASDRWALSYLDRWLAQPRPSVFPATSCVGTAADVPSPQGAPASAATSLPSSPSPLTPAAAGGTPRRRRVKTSTSCGVLGHAWEPSVDRGWSLCQVCGAVGPATRGGGR